jgi:hypothetical protein
MSDQSHDSGALTSSPDVTVHATLEGAAGQAAAMGAFIRTVDHEPAVCAEVPVNSWLSHFGLDASFAAQPDAYEIDWNGQTGRIVRSSRTVADKNTIAETTQVIAVLFSTELMYEFRDIRRRALLGA